MHYDVICVASPAKVVRGYSYFLGFFVVIGWPLFVALCIGVFMK